MDAPGELRQAITSDELLLLLREQESDELGSWIDGRRAANSFRLSISDCGSIRRKCSVGSDSQRTACTCIPRMAGETFPANKRHKGKRVLMYTYYPMVRETL